MSAYQKIVEILCCPVTKRPLRRASAVELQRLNQGIEQGNICNADDDVVGESVDEALLTEDGNTLYPVRDGIPMLLPGEAIRLER